MKPLCPGQRHDFVTDRAAEALVCRRCPLVVEEHALMRHGLADVREAYKRNRVAVEEAILDAERDWYISELES